MGRNISDQFEIHQGVKQGGLLSADLYKLYVDDLLHILESSGVGGKIGNIVLNAAACADDVLLMSNSPYQGLSIERVKNLYHMLKTLVGQCRIYLHTKSTFKIYD